MNIEIKNILNKIESEGYEAYIVGGYVRDFLLFNQTFDVDIITNATPAVISKIFNIKKQTDSYGSVSLKVDKYHFDITTYRTESAYVNRKPQIVEYTNNLLLDLQRRDFTINSICMNSNGEIFDYLNGQKDLNRRLIKVIGNPVIKLTEDPLRILRAVRFSIILDFELDKDILLFIHENKNLIDGLSFTRKKEELDKILASKNALNGLKVLKELDLLSHLNINYDIVKLVPDILGMWAQIDFSNDYPFTKDNLITINKIRLILEQGEINNYILYTNGLYICTIAADILGIDKSIINEKYLSLPIKSNQDVNINQKEIIDYLNIEPSNKIKLIYEDIIKKILNNELVNDKELIKEYILKVWK